MSIKFNQERNTFHLQAKDTSYVMEIVSTGHLLHLYWGKKINTECDLRTLLPRGLRKAHLKSEKVNNFSLDNIPQEYPAYGHTDFRQPAYQIQLEDGSTVSNLKYISHQIKKGKDKLEGLPATYVEDDNEAESLLVVLSDEKAELKVELRYTVFKDYNVITRSARLINKGEKNINIKRAFSAGVDFADFDFDLITSSGHWSRENYLNRRRLFLGVQSVESTRGASSAQHNPFLVLARPDVTEDQGEVYGFSLVYSGNFWAGVQVNNFEQARALIGINPFDFNWLLKAGEGFQTPEVVMVYSDQGLNKMSQIYHKIYRESLVRGRYRDQNRPILVNNWEATYFDFDEEKILEIAKEGKELGLELFVLDDGWFGNRDDDTSSLGDWFVDRSKLPNGLDSLVKKINKLGLRFGLWFEPEMVSPVSELYKKHPDWCIHVKGRNRSLARSQLILDLSRKEVRERILKMLTDILENTNISYVKWDMNRNMTEIGSAGFFPERQRELPHRYILGLYEMLETLREKFPEILFESCASGGGRFDPGMLYYMPQTWTSDNTDAVERLKIQYGTSLIYPLSSITAHVSAVPNHQMARITPLKTRADVAYFANFAYELDLTKLSDEEKEEIKMQVKYYKEIRQLIQQGKFYRLLSPFEGNNDTAWMVVSKNREEAIAAFYKVLAEPNPSYRRLKLKGLKEDGIYRLKNSKKLYGGDELMYAGLNLPHGFNGVQEDGTIFKGDFQSILWHFELVNR
ncbi:MAG: alpha-galactosidase [Firmicutes bacterium]|nr:alpha-galactosidase [Bacillota bacterium]